MKLVIGFITYNEFTAKYLPYFLESLKKQTFKDYKIIIQDNSDAQNNENKIIVLTPSPSPSQERGNNGYFYKNIEFNYSGSNIGFAKANNKIINRAIETGAEHILFLNPDMVLDKDAVEKLILAIEKNENLASVAPKILKWDFDNNKKTNIIDTCGIKEISALRFVDVGQGQEDNGQFDNAKIIGPSGATAMYRISALEKVKEREVKESFDERMFMYKEDCDLAYRLQVAGYKSKLVSDATVYHDRTAGAIGENNVKTAINRKNKSKQVKKWSFLNQHIIFIKHWHTLNLKRKVEVIWFALKMFVFALLFEQYLLKQYDSIYHHRFLERKRKT